MDKWLHAQFKVAENILEAVDRNISKNVQPGSEDADVPNTPSQEHAPNTPIEQDNSLNVPAITWDRVAVDSAAAKPRQAVPDSTLSGGIHTSREQSQSPSTVNVEPPASSTDKTASLSEPYTPYGLSHAQSSHSDRALAAEAEVMRPAFESPQLTSTTTPTATAAATAPATAPATATTNASHRQQQSEDADQGAVDAVTSSSSRESRLARLVDTLKRRLEEKRIENEQLEELLQKAEARANEQEQRAKQLQAAASKAIEERSSSEATFAAQLTAKEAEVSKLRSNLDGMQRQVALLETAKVVLEERNAVLLQGQEQVEAGMLEALKAEVKSIETQLESERRQHQSSKVAASSRQEELEHHLAESAAGLSSMQRKVEQVESKNFELEERLALLQAQHNRLLEQHDARSQPKSDTPTMRSASPGLGLDGPSLEVETLREEVARSRAALQAAEKARRTVETTAANLRQELAEARAGHSQPHTQLEHEVKEMSEMLYIKQTQLERLASEKASQQLLLERDLMAAREEIVRLRASSQQQRMDSSRHMHDALIPMDALGEPYQRLARHNKVGTAVTTVARFLDTTTTRFVYILRHHPLGRLIVFVYLIFVHLCLYFLTIRMQHLVVRQEAGVLQAVHATVEEHSLPGTAAS